MLCPSCLHPLCSDPPPFKDVYRVPDAFLQCLVQGWLRNNRLAVLRVVTQLFKIHSIQKVGGQGSFGT